MRQWKCTSRGVGFALSPEQIKAVRTNESFMVFTSIPLWVKELILLGIYSKVSKYSVKLTKRGEEIKYADDTNSSNP